MMVRIGHDFNVPLTHAAEAGAISANPQNSLMILIQAGNIHAGQAGFETKNLEMHAIETGQPITGSQPHIAVPVLHNGIDRILGQPGFSSPGSDDGSQPKV